MTTDYLALDVENRRRYGEETDHLAFLGELYAERSHFILELLQNAEDARATKVEFWVGKRALEVRHDGRLFNTDDVCGICSVGQSTKKAVSDRIGRFGIGFKSVYAYTGAPEIHSGDEHFAIRHFVRPAAIAAEAVEAPWTTLIRLPFDANRVAPQTAADEILTASQRLPPSTLLFLHHVGEVSFYDGRKQVAKLTRKDAETLDAGARIVRVGSRDEAPQSWVLFAKSVTFKLPGGAKTLSTVEAAFPLAENSTVKRLRVVSHPAATIAAYFPTDIKTATGFIVQGPFHTTPARDNIKRDDPHNTALVVEVAQLAVEILRWFKARGELDAAVLSTMPIRAAEFADGSLLRPVFDAVSVALRAEELLPAQQLSKSALDYVAGANAVLAHSSALTLLLTPELLAEVVHDRQRPQWLSNLLAASGDSDLARYLREVIGVRTIGVTECLAWLTTKEAAWWVACRPRWLLELYAYLDLHPKHRAAVRNLTCVRLEDGNHVAPDAGVLFFPTEDEAEATELAQDWDALPIVADALSAAGRKFLQNVGVLPLTAEAFVTRVIKPRYDAEGSVSTAECIRHLRYVREALKRIGGEEKQRVIEAVKGISIVLYREAATPDKVWRGRATDIYLGPTYTGSPHLERFFQPSPEAKFVRDDYLNTGEKPAEWREFFKQIGLADAPRFVRVQPSETTEDWHFDGLQAAMASLDAGKHAGLELTVTIWQFAVGVLRDAGANEFQWIGRTRASRKTYGPRGGDRGARSEDAEWFRRLKESAWLPDQDDECQLPDRLFIDTAENRTLMGDDAAYLSKNIDLKPVAAKWLAEQIGVRRAPSSDDIVARLRECATGAAEVEVANVLPLYNFLARNEADVSEEFAKEPLVYCPTVNPPWRSVRSLFWDDCSTVFGNDRGHLKAHYPKLGKFFETVGVRKSPLALDYLQYFDEQARAGRLDDALLMRLQKGCQQLAAYLDTDSGEVATAEFSSEWKRAQTKAIWPGRRGDQLGFFASAQLFVNDNDYLAKLFADKIATWPYQVLESFASQHLGLKRVSAAKRKCTTEGRSHPDAETTEMLRRRWDWVRAFLASPAWADQLRTTSGPISVDAPRVDRVQGISHVYSLLGATVEDSDPAGAFFDPTRNQLWFAESIVTPGELAEAVGEELAKAFGPDALREFVRDAFERETEPLLKKWVKNGLILPSTPPIDSTMRLHPANEHTEAGIDDDDGPSDDSQEIAGDPSPGGEFPTGDDEDDDQFDGATSDADEEGEADDDDEDEGDEEAPSAARSRSSVDHSRAGSGERSVNLSTPSRSSPVNVSQAPASAGRTAHGPAGQPQDQSASRAKPGSVHANLEAAFNRPGETKLRRDPIAATSVPDEEARRAQIRTELVQRRSAEPNRSERLRAQTANVLESKDKAVREFLQQEYGGDCQICGDLNVFARGSDGQPYFEGVYLSPHAEAAWTDRPGNVISLCALCSAKWQNGDKRTPDLEAQILRLWADDHGPPKRSIAATLTGRAIEVRFTKRHSLELQELWKMAAHGKLANAVPASPVATGQNSRQQQMTMQSCPKCSSPVRKDRLERHLTKSCSMRAARVAGPVSESALRQAVRPDSTLVGLWCADCRQKFQGFAGTTRCQECRKRRGG